mgnify:CR=1 FL=1
MVASVGRAREGLGGGQGAVSGVGSGRILPRSPLTELPKDGTLAGQIEAKAVRKLQHPVRSRKLEGFIDSLPGNA